MSVDGKTEKKSGGLGETVSVIVQALLLALVIRTLLFQPFSIPSGSMRPTLLEGDYLFVTKWAYGYSRHSLPFSPDIFDGRIWGSEPERGDVVVFKFPPNPSLDYIKRVIGLPGDRIQVRDGVLFINGQEVPREKVGEIDNPDITEVVDITQVPDQMKVFDTLSDAKVTLIDVRAGLLSTTLAALRDIDFLETVKRGQISLGVAHILGSSVASLNEIADRIPRGASAAFILLEHLWAIGLKEGLRNANGVVLAHGWLTPATLIAMGEEAAAEVEAGD